MGVSDCGFYIEKNLMASKEYLNYFTCRWFLLVII